LTDYSNLPIRRFRFHGLRKLNWAARPWGADYFQHLAEAGLDRWIEPGPLLIVVGPNAGGKSTVIDLFQSLGDARLSRVISTRSSEAVPHPAVPRSRTERRRHHHFAQAFKNKSRLQLMYLLDKYSIRFISG
jgi:ABC-type branched-subunit amino acid transport system ATPase component